MDMNTEYETLCRLIGPWTDWIQGPGGNISVKNTTEILLKKSGALVSAPNNWVRCDLVQLRKALENSQENAEHTVLEGTGKPSIEAFLHSFPPRIIVHTHPYPLLNRLCSDEPFELPMLKSATIDYFKPGIPLANAMASVYSPDIPVYFLRNHGVVVMGNTIDDILHRMVEISKTYFPEPHTDVLFAYNLFNAIHSTTGKQPILKSCLPVPSPMLDRLFLPFTPDSVVFLHEAPLAFEEPQVIPSHGLEKYIKKYKHIPSVVYTKGVCYLIGYSVEACYSIYEILLSYVHVTHPAKFLSEAQVLELVNWDKEKLRQTMNR